MGGKKRMTFPVPKTEECERRAEKGRNFHSGNEVEQQRAQTGAQQCGGNVQTGNGRNQNSGAEHGEHMLQAENQDFRLTKAFGIVYSIHFFRIGHR